MLFIRSSASECSVHYFKLVAVILLLGEIMPICSCYAEKKLVYIIIMAPFSRQSSSCTKYTKLNMRSSCNVQLVSNAKYMFLVSVVLFYLSHSLGTNT